MLFVGILKVTEEKNRIWIQLCNPVVGANPPIREYGSKRQGTGTLPGMIYSRSFLVESTDPDRELNWSDHKKLPVEL
jgi:hypothetical protein